MTANINPKTGVRFGYIHADALHPEVVDALLYGSQAKNLSYEQALEEHMARARSEFESERTFTDEFDANFEEDKFSERYQGEEECIEGTYEGVSYCTSWLGGALHIFLLVSPVTARGNLCSPCVPNALDCGSVGKGDYEGYYVPNHWLQEERL